jgi:polyphosphate glucokinase
VDDSENGKLVKRLSEFSREKVESTTKKKYQIYNPVKYITHIAESTTYYIKVDVGNRECIHLRVPHNGQNNTSNLQAFRTGLHQQSFLDNFETTKTNPEEYIALGIDIGGTGMKAALVDLEKGKLSSQRHRIPTPQPSTVESCMKVLEELIAHFNWKGKKVGITFPGVIIHGKIKTAANFDKGWVDYNLETELKKRTGCDTKVLNDADAAGIGEMYFGAGRGAKGVTFIITLGTGIGSALFIDNILVPNTEFGHMQIRGKDAEWRASDKVRRDDKMNFKKWSKRVDEFLKTLEFLFSPSLFIIGGGVCKKHKKFFPHLTLKTKIVPAELLNEAGIVGSAMSWGSLTDKK